MKHSCVSALTLIAVVASLPDAAAQTPTGCNDFLRLRASAEQEATAVRTATEHKAERKEVCTLVQRFAVAEAAAVNFLEVNKTWCGVPDQVVQQAKANHERTLKFRAAICVEIPAASSQDSSVSKTPSAALAKDVARMRVPLKSDGGIFVVPVQINGAITLNFAVDSGAADVTVPADVFSTLRRTGTINSSDMIGEQTYALADGSQTQSLTFNIRSLKVGGKFVENIRGSVQSSQGSLLLGQSFLERFKSWSIDNKTHELVLEP
jgi:clan AA aspartic protease (TIGR02281 family)